MHYKKLWTDLHSNIHHNQMGELNQWIEHAKKTVDFWPVAYYPFYMKRTETGAGLEDLYDREQIEQDWEQLREAVKQQNEAGYPMFMGYEWQAPEMTETIMCSFWIMSSQCSIPCGTRNSIRRIRTGRR